MADKKKYLFQLNHPAHFHLFKNTIDALEANGHKVLISIKDKDILKDLVSDYDYVQLTEGYRKKNIISILKSLFTRDRKLYKIAKNFRPDLMIGTSPEIGQISPFLGIPSLFFGEDDVNLSTIMYLGALSCYPLFDGILAPVCVNNGIWNKKTTFYQGFQKLAYLHPNHFTPQRDKVSFDENERYFIIRFSGLTAYHDTGISGINDSLASSLIEELEKHGTVVISSERPLPDFLEKYRFKGNVKDMHHYLAYADLFIGDSQTMCAEAGLLGTPFIRYNDFVGKIGYLNEIENDYLLGFGIESGEKDQLIDKVKELMNTDDLKTLFTERKDKMLEDKIDVTAFYIWFIENYPKSKKIMRKDEQFQYRFK